MSIKYYFEILIRINEKNLTLFVLAIFVFTNNQDRNMDHSKKFLYLMSRAMNRLKYYSINRFNEGGVTVTPSQMGILFLLKSVDSLPMSSISTALSVDNSTLTRHADKLIKREFIERVKDDSDRRVLRLRITDTGLKECDKAVRITSRINAEVISGLTEEEVIIFSKVLMNIINKFE